MMSNTAAQKQISARIRNGVYTALACAALLLAQSCTDVFHELIPPADSGIHSFSVANADRTLYHAAETGSTDITISVPADTDVTALVPVITLDEKSTVIPVTLPYIHRAFPSADLMSLAVQMNASQKAGGLGNWMLNFIRENKDFTVPPLDEPVDFSQPVMFCVIAGRGNYKLYTVTVVPEKTEQPTQPDQPSPTEPDEPETPDNPPVPPATVYEKNILSFVINDPPQTKPSVITEDTVTFSLNAGADRSALYPLVTVSEGAGLLPLTQEYLLRLFSYTELISFYSGYASATDISAFISATVKKLDADKIAKIMAADLSLPIDFSGWNSLFGVPFAVIGADKTAHVYYVSCVTDEDSAALTAFAVTKIRNPGLMGDADVSFAGDTVTITATYPVEYRNFALIPDIVIEGDSWEITGGTLRAESVGTGNAEEAEYAAGLAQSVRLVPGDVYPVGKEYTATLTVRRGEAAAAYTLRLTYQEDPDTIRSITDFRFLRLRNPGIKTTAMASISKSEDTGFISATVLYEGGEPPYELVADFYSPGTCTVNHAEQVSGKSGNNFQYDVQVLCTSKNKLFCRLYTVHVTFVKVKTAEAVLNYFAFPKHLNPGLSQSATGLIDESSGTVYVNAKYHTPEKPARLVPEFAATGTVTVNSILQSSGYSAQDFSRSVYYAVRDQNEWSSDSRTYRVSVNWEQDEQSACAITAFGFSTADNPSLTKDVAARINERAGTIYALLPKGAGKDSLAPYFSAQGTVTVDGTEQTSGGSPHDFSGEVIYTVTSANGLYSMQYAVSVQEAGPVIYVNAAAVGRNNGTCWQDAYITLDAAFEQAAAYGDANKEIWIAHNGGAAYEPLSDEYRQKGLPLTANTIIRGGFVGGETDANKRPTKTRKIEFDVNAVENAREGKRKKIEIRREANVCETQTKLYMPNDGDTGSYFFRSAPSGRIEFDGLEIEKETKDEYKSGLFYHEDTDEPEVFFSDCTVRCYSLTDYYHGSWRSISYTIENSDSYVHILTGKSIRADGSNFFKPETESFISLCLTNSLTLKTCVFQTEPERPCKVVLANKTDVNSCFFDNIFFDNFNSEQTILTNCLYSCEHSYSSIAVKKITDCELKTKSGSIWFIGYYDLKDATITNSYIEGFNHTISGTKLSVENSMLKKSAFGVNGNSYNGGELDMTGTTVEETGSRLIQNDERYGYDMTVTLKDCTFSASQDSSTAYNDDYISLSSENSRITIDNCTFNIHGNRLLYTKGSATIKDSNFLCEQGIDIDSRGATAITGNTFETKGNIRLYLNTPHNQEEKKTEFTGNQLYGQYTYLRASNIQKLEGNHYDNFVEYELYKPDNDGVNFLTEKIENKEPKQAFLSLSDGDIRIDNKFDKNFLCGLYLYNANAFITGQELGNMPSCLKSYVQHIFPSGGADHIDRLPVSGFDSRLELTDCTVKGTTADAIQVSGSLTVDKSTINGNIKRYRNSPLNEVKVSESTVGDIDGAKTITAENANITGSITGNTGYSTDITLRGVTVNGAIYDLGNNSSVHTFAYNGKRTNILGTDLQKNYSIWYLPDCSGEISCTDTDMTGGIYGGNTITTKHAKIGGCILFSIDAKIEFSRSQITNLETFRNLNNAYKIEILGSTVEDIYLYENTNNQASLSTNSIDGFRSTIHQINIPAQTETKFSFYDTDFDGKNERTKFHIKGNDITISNCKIYNYVYKCDYRGDSHDVDIYGIYIRALNKLDIINDTTFRDNYINLFIENDSADGTSHSYGNTTPIQFRGHQIYIDTVLFSNNKVIGNMYSNTYINSPIYIYSSSKEGCSINIENSEFSNMADSAHACSIIYICHDSYSSSTNISSCKFSNNNNIPDIRITLAYEGSLSVYNCTTDKSKSLEPYFWVTDSTALSFHRILEVIQAGFFKTDGSLPLCY